MCSALLRDLGDPAEYEWLVFDGQVERGPFSTAELVERFSNGEIMPSDHVWKPGMDIWRPAYAAGLQRLAVQPEAIPLNSTRNHPRALESSCPPSTAPYHRGWRAHGRGITRSARAQWERERRGLILEQVLQRAPQLRMPMARHLGPKT